MYQMAAIVQEVGSTSVHFSVSQVLWMTLQQRAQQKPLDRGNLVDLFAGRALTSCSFAR